ncbi:RagB/SusD family nutrient uptake outer membrane protein [Pedobacter sp. AW1-32]|uniref:RagB/SusD family nutrient uptake outer membrane protein n=1 Tax=Pedobacter sp. AW1-32 TaxID=3383026 RepID=UPI003FEF3382
MKKLYILCLVLILGMGCKKDLLNTTPYSQISSADMWTTADLTDLGLAGVYSAIRLGQNTSDASGRELYQYDRYSFGGQTRNTDAFTSGTINSTSGLFSSTWQELYEGVQRANDGILNIPLKSPISNELKGRYVAECRFLRAYFYFRLNQVFKGVPIYLEPYLPAEATRPRSTEQQVWDQIVADLTVAINESNLPNFYAAGNANYGHITKGAAYALRGKVYMYQRRWAEAIADFTSVRAAGYSLFNNYRELFRTANEQSPEMIFSIQNIGQSGLGSTTQFFCGSRSAFGSNWNTYLISPNLVDLYENIDGSKFNWDTILPGYSSMSNNEREVFFLRDNLTAAEISSATARGARMSLYLPIGNEARILRAYANRDPRLASSVITPYSTFAGTYAGVTATLTSRWPYRLESAVNGDLRTDTPDRFYYLHRKFVYEGISEIVNRAYGPTDFPLIRFADVLLMWAEALNEQGQTTEALARLNEVRSRAGIPAVQNSNASLPTFVADQAGLRERIRNERRIEFINEGIDYFDELRWGTWREKVFPAGAGLKQVWGTNVVTYTYLGDYINTWPIPQTERERNPNLTQNPGWN